ncbi:RagB/SusD family nutrient uptake outer membrane protein [Membranihabitans maritimus]|uniref:RagB/SusD family nutrient uptake outer membrane protein n=1 Tax=Membranihabitans maritimus TaxID=2904244 RepID=UPI001F23A0DD|nr:RagB/SusD family nutrient uptake outer membrane protein [Membranihabitans maritimus]
MKTSIYIVTFVCLFTCAQSCQDFLREQAFSQISNDNFYKSQQDALAGVNSIYSILNDGAYFGGNGWYFGDVSADQANNGEVTGELDVMDYNPAINTFRGYWTILYRGINYANNVITYVPGIQMDEDLRNRYVGEARFLRAMFYFDLVRGFGDVPLILEPTTDESNNILPRSGADEIYTTIEEDLVFATQSLPESYGSSDIGRATRGAARSMLAKVYLTRGDYANARTQALAVMDSETYQLFEDYRDVFRVENENGKEHIFSVQFMSGASSGLASSFTSAFASRNPNLLFGGLRAGSAIAAEDDFYNGFPDHYRKSITLVDSFPSAYYPEITAEGRCQAGPACMKYWDPNLIAESQGDANWMVLRYADVILMFAEAENEVNGPTQDAYDAINSIRKRARDANANGVDEADERAQLPDLAGLSKEAFREAVWAERAMELCFEGHRRWDLLRTGRFVDVMVASGKPAQDRHRLFPIPLLEIQANTNLNQNPGY